MTMRMTVSVAANKGALSRANLKVRTDKFLAEERSARLKAAKAATGMSRASFTYKRKPDGQQRPGRSSSGGRMARLVEWNPTAQNSDVVLDVKTLDAFAPHWIIHEIGTGSRGQMRQGGQGETRGGRTVGADQLRTVKSQMGRLIPEGLVFASGGKYTAPGHRRAEQLHLRSQVSGAPLVGPTMSIEREIEAQNFIQKGADTGFRQYRTSVLTAARQAFQKGFTS